MLIPYLARRNARPIAVRTRLFRFHVAALALCFTLSLAAGPDTANAGRAGAKKSISIAVVGDSLANDLGQGMEALFSSRPNVRISKQTHFSTGLVRVDYFNWYAHVRRFVNSADPDVIVVVIGGNDRQTIRMKGLSYNPYTKGWMREYERRVDYFMRSLKRADAKIYWVGLPVVRSDKLSRSYRAMNSIFRRQAKRHGFNYVAIWDEFLGPDDAYSSFGKSLNGVKRRLRKKDGMHFTETGKLRFAAYVAEAIGLR